MRKLEDIEKEIYMAQHLLRTLHMERNLLIQLTDTINASAKLLTAQAIERMKK